MRGNRNVVCNLQVTKSNLEVDFNPLDGTLLTSERQQERCFVTSRLLLVTWRFNLTIKLNLQVTLNHLEVTFGNLV